MKFKNGWMKTAGDCYAKVDPRYGGDIRKMIFCSNINTVEHQLSMVIGGSKGPDIRKTWLIQIIFY
jgi:hypothetical protein